MTEKKHFGKLPLAPAPALALAALALVLILCGIAGCGKKGSPPASGSRYEGETFPVPEDILNVYTQIEPYYDEETGALTCLGYLLELTDLPEGGTETHNHFRLITSTREEVFGDEEIPVGDGRSITCGIIRPEAAYLLIAESYKESPSDNGWKRNYYLGRYDRGTGELTVSEDILRFFGNADHSSFYTEEMTADGDGNFYVFDGKREIAVFSPDFVYQTSVPTSDYVRMLGPSPDGDGTVLVLEDLIMKDRLFRRCCALDPEARTLTERFRFATSDGMGNTHMGPDGAVYIGSPSGIWRVRPPEDGGTARPELAMDYAASDVMPDNAYLAAALDGDRIVLVERTMKGDRWYAAPALYTRAEDADLTGVTVLTLAYDRTDAALASKIVAFNKAHRDVRIVTADYAQYITADDPEAGSERLALDIVSGVLKPDIVVSSPDSDAVRQLYEKKLYADLGPYLAADDLVNPDNLFGAIRHAFDDGQGGMWGLSTGFSLVTLVSTRALLPGSAAERGFWTLSEMADFAASLPDGVAFAEIPCREYFKAAFTVSDGLGEFIDRDAGTCSFDTPAFCRVLTYLASLPSMEEVTASGALPWAGLPEEEAFLPYLEGKVALRSFTLQSPAEVIGLSALFGTDNYVLIGLPAAEPRGGAGIVAEMDDAVVLTSFCSSPDAGWEMIRSLFEGEARMTFTMNGAILDPLPPLRSQTDRMIDSYNAGGMEFCFYYDGSSEMRRADPEDPAALDRPGIVSSFTDEKREELYAILDGAGSPLALRTDAQIAEIMNEELSALYAGSCSVEDCAARIQSRVSIWLSEHR